jgi:hypothetical protein
MSGRVSQSKATEEHAKLTAARSEARRLAALLEAAVTKRNGAYFSAKVTRNAKQDYQFEVESNGDVWQGVLADVIEAANSLEERYPANEPTDSEAEAKRLGNAARIHAARAKKAAAK